MPREDIDDIIGIVYAKDILRCINETPDEMSQQTHHLPSSVPLSFSRNPTRCSDLFKTFKEKKTQMAIVVDEYGGTSGVVTMEDLLGVGGRSATWRTNMTGRKRNTRRSPIISLSWTARCPLRTSELLG